MAKKNIAKRAEEAARKAISARDSKEAAQASERAQKVVDSGLSVVVSSIPESGTETPVSRGETVMLQRINQNRKGSALVYKFAQGGLARVKISRSAFGAEIPETLSDNLAEWPLAPATKPKSKMTKEERAALRASLTPQDKVAAAKERARKATERAARLEAQLAASAGATT